MLTEFLVDLSIPYGLISVEGNDVQKFLQGQLTCDMRDITPEKPGMGAYCNLKGRIRALFRIFIRDNTYYLLLPKNVLPNTISHLKKYALFSKITVKDASTTFQCLGICHYSSSANRSNLTSLLENPNCTVLTVSSEQDIVIFPAEHPLPIHVSNINTVQWVDFEVWKLLDIRNGIPQVWLETVEQFLPHDLNLPQLGAVSFTKGCYCGQEIIARMEYRGKLKRHLQHIILPSATDLPLPGTKLFSEQEPEKEMGTVVSACFNPKHHVELLIVMN